MNYTRRRLITIAGAAAGLALMPAAPGMAITSGGDSQLRTWRGTALGADATLQIHHHDPRVADRLIERSVAEVRRLEKIFSLYDQSTTISLLNRQGYVDAPSPDFLTLLSESQGYSRLTDGAFDMTVQPLWLLYGRHFERAHADPEGPSDAERKRALALVGHEKVVVDEARVQFDRAGLGITLNGIAQGYITDRVTDILLDAGIEETLVDMGEIRAIGNGPSGTPWQVGLEDPRNPAQVTETINVTNLAVSTSGGYGTAFGPAGQCNHIFDPRTGLSSRRYLCVSVVAPRATMSDALSTAFSLMPLEQTASIVQRFGIKARFVLPDGSEIWQAAS